MKRKGLLAVFLAVVLSGTTAWADFYVIAGGGAVGTKITSVPYEIKDSGFYYLGGNLIYSGSGNAVTISADDVTLDLMGFSLTKSGLPGTSHGIYMDGRTNVEIRNGTVRGFWFGVYEKSNSGNQHRVLNVRSTANIGGIAFNGSNHLVKGCNAWNNSGDGISLIRGFVTGCMATSNSTGIRVQHGGIVLGNTAIDNSIYNFSFGTGYPNANILVDQNSASGLTTNYYVPGGTTGIQWGINAGTP